MPTIEGFTPSVAWTTGYGVIAICIIVSLVLTAYEKIQHVRDRKKKAMEAQQPGLADQISKKVLDQFEPRLKDIEVKLDKDKARLDNHEQLFDQIQKTNTEIRDGLHAYGKTMLVLLNHGDFGQSKEVKDASDELTRFLAERV